MAVWGKDRHRPLMRHTSIFAPARSKGSKMERMPLIRGVVASGFSGPSQTLGAPYLMVVMPPGQQCAGHTDAVMKLL